MKLTRSASFCYPALRAFYFASSYACCFFRPHVVSYLLEQSTTAPLHRRTTSPQPQPQRGNVYEMMPQYAPGLFSYVAIFTCNCGNFTFEFRIPGSA